MSSRLLSLLRQDMKILGWHLDQVSLGLGLELPSHLDSREAREATWLPPRDDRTECTAPTSRTGERGEGAIWEQKE